MEQYTWVNSLRFFGIPEQNGENTVQVIINLCTKNLGVAITPLDIDYWHQLARKNGESRFNVKFCRRFTKIMVYKNKSKLKDSKIVIREDLTKQRVNMISALVKITSTNSVFTNNDNVFVKVIIGRFQLSLRR